MAVNFPSRTESGTATAAGTRSPRGRRAGVREASNSLNCAIHINPPKNVRPTARACDGRAHAPARHLHFPPPADIVKQGLQTLVPRLSGVHLQRGAVGQFGIGAQLKDQANRPQRHGLKRRERCFAQDRIAQIQRNGDGGQFREEFSVRQPALRHDPRFPLHAFRQALPDHLKRQSGPRAAQTAEHVEDGVQPPVAPDMAEDPDGRGFLFRPDVRHNRPHGKNLHGNTDSAHAQNIEGITGMDENQALAVEQRGKRRCMDFQGLAPDTGGA